jgi:predicted Rdx family selenoprotein
MTNEEFAEEILWEAHSNGTYKEVMELSKKLRDENRDLSFADSVYKAHVSLEFAE